MNMDIFNQIIRSNKNMNETVEGFVEQVHDVKKEVNTILAKKSVFLWENQTHKNIILSYVISY